MLKEVIVDILLLIIRLLGLVLVLLFVFIHLQMLNRHIQCWLGRPSNGLHCSGIATATDFPLLQITQKRFSACRDGVRVNSPVMVYH